MNKSAIALSIAAAMAASAAAQAETTFYGRIATGLSYTDPDLGDKKLWDVFDSGSRFGVRGSEDLGNGLSAVYQFEIDINADRLENARTFDGRLGFVGLKGGFGQVTAGSQWSQYYDSLGATDIFNEADWFSYYQGPFRQRNTFRYDLPDSLGGFGGGVTLQVDGDTDSALKEAGLCPETVDDCGHQIFRDKDLDEWQVAVRYSGGPFFVGAAYRSIEIFDDSIWSAGITGSFDFLGASIAALYERTKDKNLDTKTDTYYVTAQYMFGNNILKAGWGRLKPDGFKDLDDLFGSDKGVDEWALGFQHNLGSRTRVWVEYQDEDDDGKFATLGLRHDW